MQRGNKSTRILLVIIVFYSMVSVGKLVYKNYELRKQEEKLRSDIASLENEIQDLKNKIVYYQSDAYKEKMIRAKLNMKKEGEEVVVIAANPEPEKEDSMPEEPKSNPQKWVDYFFGE